MHDQLVDEDPTAPGMREVRVGDRAVPVLTRDGHDAEHEREQGHQPEMRHAAPHDGRIGAVGGDVGSDDPEGDDHLGRGEQHPRRTDGAELEDLLGHQRRPSTGSPVSWRNAASSGPSRPASGPA